MMQPPPVSEDEVAPAVAFTLFYESELAGQVRRATLLLGSPEEAHDVVHDAFVEVFRRWEEIEAPGPYLQRSVLNRCRGVGRRRATAASRLHLLLPDVSTSEEYLWDALQSLPFPHRAALVLRYYEQLSEAEIAELLGCRPGSVGPWIRRGLRQLRKDLA